MTTPVLRLGVNINLQQLIMMGYDEELAQKALQATSNTTVEAAIDWLESRPKTIPPNSNKPTPTEPPKTKKPASDELTEEDKKRILWEKQRGEREAARIREEREKAKLHEQKVKLQIEEAKRKRQELDKSNQLDLSADARNELEKQRAEQRAQAIAAKERREAKEHAERIKLQLEEASKRRHGDVPQEPKPKAPTTETSKTVETKQPKKEYQECILQLRLPSGQTVKELFSGSDCLLEVHNYVASMLEPGFNFILFTPYPKRDFCGNDLFSTLQDLGLAPRAVLQVLETVERGVVKFVEGPEAKITKTIMEPPKKIQNRV